MTAPAPPELSARGLLWAAVRSRRRDLIAACTLYSTHQIGEALVPVIVGGAVGHAVDGGSAGSLGFWLLILGADFAFLSMSFRHGARASMRAKQHAGHTSRLWLTDRVVAPAGGVGQSPGDLLSRASSDATRVGAYAGMIAVAVAATVVLIASTVLLLTLSVTLGAVIIVGTALLLAVQNRVSVLLQRRSATEQHEQARATALAEDIVRGLRVLRGIRAERTAAAEYRRVSARAADAAVRATSSAATITGVAAMLSGLYLAVIAAVGGALALDGQIGLGSLISALGLARFIIGPMRVVSQASAAYARAIASAGRIHDVLTSQPTVVGVVDTTCVVHQVPALRFKATPMPNVGPLSVTIPAGELTGLVCGDPHTAAAIVAALGRESDPVGGCIEVTGRDGRWHEITTLELSALRAAVLVSPHDSVLLPGTIDQNLRLLASVEKEAVFETAITAAGADQVIDIAPLAGDTSVGDRGETLSGGQRQRVALARVLVADPPLLVLQDPTTAVDAATEGVIAGRVRTLRTGRTTLVVTTSPGWLMRCDSVVHVGANGIRTASHGELVTSDAVYRELIDQ